MQAGISTHVTDNLIHWFDLMTLVINKIQDVEGGQDADLLNITEIFYDVQVIFKYNGGSSYFLSFKK